MGSAEIVIALGALVGGFVSGVTGFGTSLVAVPIWLWILSPTVAAPLAAAGGAISQLQTLPTVWHAIQWRKLPPFIIPGLVGIPIGTLLLPIIDLHTFRLCVGTLLIVFCGFMLFLQGRVHFKGGGGLTTIFVGFGGGVLGGLMAFPGPLPVIWVTLRDWTKDQKRGFFQCFNFTMLSAMLAASAIAGLLTKDFFISLAVSLPTTVVGAQLGRIVYRNVDARRFDRLVLALLMLSGFALVR